MQLKKKDPQLSTIIQQEEQRQSSCMSLIASENYASCAVMEAQGSILTNKYAEGYPGKRYYGGCECVDEVENLAIERAKKLFSAQYVNVQPHSGSQANQAVFLALLKPHQKILGMSLNDGGHLTHGSHVNLSGMWFQAIHYGVDKNSGRIDYHHVRDIALKHRPSMIIAGFSCYSRTVNFQIFREIADEVGAFLLVDMAHSAGLVAGKVSPNPLPHAHVVTATTHKTLRGPRGGLIMSNDEIIGKRIKKALFPGLQGGPLMHIIAAKALAFHEALQPEFQSYSQNVVKNAQVLSHVLEKHFKIVSGGTDNHIVSVDLRPHPINGKEAEERLQNIRLICNKNTVPGETGTPFAPSGIRIGTAAATTRGLKEKDFETIGMMIKNILLEKDEVSLIKKYEKETHLVEDFCQRYPLSPNLSVVHG